MTLTHLLVFAAAALLALIALPARGRAWALFAASVVAIYWLQPALTIRRLDFVFPTATLGLVVLAWLLTRAPGQCIAREDAAAAALIAALVLLLAFGRALAPAYRITPSMPPPLGVVVLWLAGGGIALAALSRIPGGKARVLLALAVGIVALFAVLKTESLAAEAAGLLRAWTGQSPDLARADELQWLGFSYVAFRLLHTARDRQTGLLPPLTLREYTTYAIFFPAFTAGPIDRAERFLGDLRALPAPDTARFVQGGMRIAVGVGKKFVIADSLAILALDTAKAEAATSTLGLWALLYAYAFQIYFDFSGYTDIAIGLGQWCGVRLPENFNQPYLKRNITAFWQSWHITLGRWVRFYVFSPLSRTLLARPRKPSPTALALVGQLVTMLIIGLWHGITWGFAAWGLWHGVGLFVHKVYSDRTRAHYLRLRAHPRLGRAVQAAGVLITFHFVVLGWVWFALPDIGTSWDVFIRLLGG
jgi:D-alanyl-lipoteichoic acid acyltransferase DltB (MBOAT superfamily)